MRRCPAGGPGGGLALLRFGAFAGLFVSGADPLGCGRVAAGEVLAAPYLLAEPMAVVALGRGQPLLITGLALTAVPMFPEADTPTTVAGTPRSGTSPGRL